MVPCNFSNKNNLKITSILLLISWSFFIFKLFLYFPLFLRKSLLNHEGYFTIKEIYLRTIHKHASCFYFRFLVIHNFSQHNFPNVTIKPCIFLKYSIMFFIYISFDWYILVLWWIYIVLSLFVIVKLNINFLVIFLMIE